MPHKTQPPRDQDLEGPWQALLFLRDLWGRRGPRHVCSPISIGPQSLLAGSNFLSNTNLSSFFYCSHHWSISSLAMGLRGSGSEAFLALFLCFPV